MRVFLITLNWCLNYLFFKIVLLGNKRVLSRFERRLFKVIPLKPIHSVESNVAINVTAEYEIRSKLNRGYMLHYAQSERFFAGNRNSIKDDHVVVPVRIFCPVKASRVFITGKYETLTSLGMRYADQEFSDVSAGWFDGVLFVKFKDN